MRNSGVLLKTGKWFIYCTSLDRYSKRCKWTKKSFGVALGDRVPLVVKLRCSKYGLIRYIYMPVTPMNITYINWKYIQAFTIFDHCTGCLESKLKKSIVTKYLYFSGCDSATKKSYLEDFFYTFIDFILNFYYFSIHIFYFLRFIGNLLNKSMKKQTIIYY